VSRIAPTRRVLPGCRQRSPVLRALLPAAALAAAVLFAGCAQKNANPGYVINPAESSERVRVTETTRLKRGTFFRIFENTEERASERSLEEELLWLAERSDLGITAARRAAAKEIADSHAQLSLDELAWTTAAALEASLSQILQIGFVRAIEKDSSRYRDGLADMSSSFHASPGKIATKPLGAAIVLQRIVLHGAARMFERFPAPVVFSGSYALATAGDCNVAAGRYELVQRERIFELVESNRIVMYGAIGASHAFFVPNDTRYVRISREPGKPVELLFPDRNAEIMTAKIDQPHVAIVVSNRPQGDCIMILRNVRNDI
jgi:hypothetical protein